MFIDLARRGLLIAYSYTLLSFYELPNFHFYFFLTFPKNTCRDSLPDRGDYPDTYIRHILRFSVPVVSLFAAHAENPRTFLLFK